MIGFGRRHPILSFFLLAWAFSWLAMVPLALAGRGVIAPLPGWLHYLSAYGPLLPALRRGHGPRAASFAIACGWMIWHIPAFFYLPSYARFGVGDLVGFFLGVLSGAYLLTWLSIASRGGALLPIVWHGLFNFTTAPPSSGGLVAAVVSTSAMVMGILAFLALARDRAERASRSPLARRRPRP